jgi:hypothetical protein
MVDTCPFSMDKALGQILPKSFVSLTVRRAVFSSFGAAPLRFFKHFPSLHPIFFLIGQTAYEF